MDDYILNRRTMQDEFDIVRTCIDANLTIPEEKINIKLPKAKGSKDKKKGDGRETTTRYTHKSQREEPKLKSSSTRSKDIKTISKEKMKESIAGVPDSNNSDDNSDLDFEEAGLEFQEEGKALRKRASIMRKERIAERVQKANDLDFLNYLQTQALPPPSMEFLPDFDNFVNIMQKGVIFIESPLNKKRSSKIPLKKGNTATVIKLKKT